MIGSTRSSTQTCSSRWRSLPRRSSPGDTRGGSRTTCSSLSQLACPFKSVEEVKVAAVGTAFCRDKEQYTNLLTPREIFCLMVAYLQLHDKHRADLDNGEVFCLID